jgi:chromosome segregation ATPase
MSDELTPRMPQGERIDRLSGLVNTLVSEMREMRADITSIKDELEERRGDTKPLILETHATVREVKTKVDEIEKKLDGFRRETSGEFREAVRRQDHDRNKLLDLEERIERIEQRLEGGQ